MSISEHDVIIAGAGPTGLMLAGELALAGVDVAVVERRPNQDLDGWRAGGLHPRTIEVLDQRGIADRFVAQGQKYPLVMFPGTRLTISDLPTRHNYWLALWQAKIEEGLADWVSEFAVRIYRGGTVTGFVQSDAAVDVALTDGRSLRAQYLVGCDGGRSIIRKQAGIDFPGWTPSISYLIAEADMADEPAWGLRHGEKGVHAIARLDDGKRARLVVTEAQLGQGAEPTEGELRGALLAAYGTDFGIRDISWLSRFTDAARQAAVYRKSRVLIAGDAAHVHSPAGGQGLNLGIQDAVNLGWKLAQVVKGATPETLLDTYQAERHPVGARVLKSTLAITALNRGDERTTALRDMMSGVMEMDEPRQWYAATMSGLDIRYEIGDGHPLIGRRMPDLDMMTGHGPTRVFSHLHAGRPVLLNFGLRESLDDARWPDRIKCVDAEHVGGFELPIVGRVDTPQAVLIRPDGYVAWAGETAGDGLMEAVTAWH